ncbi:MAG TPA: replication-relaxation family protein [Solirubrobacteraceae bacterium]|nr:replication-relaxation family protein [Solirubrobacteraceae bacterium]
MLAFLAWRLLGLLAAGWGASLLAWMLSGGPGRLLRGAHGGARAPHDAGAILGLAVQAPSLGVALLPRGVRVALGALAVAVAGCAAVLAALRVRARRRRRCERLRIVPYRADNATAEALVALFAALHRRLQRRWWRRLVLGQPSLALEVRNDMGKQARFTVACPAGERASVEAAVRGAYANCAIHPDDCSSAAPSTLLRLKKRAEFIRRAKALDRFEQERSPPVNALLRAMTAAGESSLVQLALTPAPASFERFAAHLFRRRERDLARRRGEPPPRTAGMLAGEQLRGGLELQHRPLFFLDARVLAGTRPACERIAAELRAQSSENELVPRGTALRDGRLRVYRTRIARGEGNWLPSWHKGVFAASELAALWQLPSSDFAAVPLERAAIPLAPAPPGVHRPASGPGMLRDALGPVSIHPELRRQNTAAPGAVEQGKSSFLVATIAEDLERERCAVIVLDPKGDAADAALSVVPAERVCTLLDLANPTCGFNPLAVDAPADVIADYVVGAVKNLFTDADIRASSDRYLRNAIIAVLAYDRRATLWDAARLLSVGEEGYAYRSAVGARVRGLPELREIAMFFTAELSAQLADARSATTAKLDAPVNKLARLLNSPSIKRVLLNDSLEVRLDDVIARGEVLIVKGALGAMGAGNTSVVMQLLVGMLDAALARQQDLVPARERVAVALKIDEAPLVLNRGFAETMALKRSAGLETVACWQSDAQWTEREVRDQLDALFAHRVYFATASTRDARAAAPLTMPEFSDTVRPGITRLSALSRPDARLHLPKHHAIVSLATSVGRQQAFVASTIPLRVDPARLALHARHQRERGGRALSDLRQPHWEHLDARPRDQREKLASAGTVERRREEPRSLARRCAQPGPLPLGVAPSYAELVDLDRAHRVRRIAGAGRPLAHVPDALDMAILELVADVGHALSSQIHARVNAGRAATTTQRRLKRLADAGLIERTQFHRRDGGGVPMCCAPTERAGELLEGAEPPSASAEPEATRAIRANTSPPQRLGDARDLAGLRRAIHVTAWMLAVERTIGTRCKLNGGDACAISPPFAEGERRAPLGPAALRLPGGRVAHDFLLTTADGDRVPAARFETLRPHGTICAPGFDVLIECDDRLPREAGPAKLERYDHFLAGWSMHTRRYGIRRRAHALVVFLCRDRDRARELAHDADAVLGACRAYPGDYPYNWEYPGRERIVFAAERDAHEGSLAAFCVPVLPPRARELAARGEPDAARPRVEACEISSSAPPS